MNKESDHIIYHMLQVARYLLVKLTLIQKIKNKIEIICRSNHQQDLLNLHYKSGDHKL